MSDELTTVADLRRAMQAFVAARDWQQFHTPKNLAMSIAIEAAELMEHFQWTDAAGAIPAAQLTAQRAEIADEIADVCWYVLSLVDALELDLSTAMRAKLEKTERKYPADQFRGRSQ